MADKKLCYQPIYTQNGVRNTLVAMVGWRTVVIYNRCSSNTKLTVTDALERVNLAKIPNAEGNLVWVTVVNSETEGLF